MAPPRVLRGSGARARASPIAGAGPALSEPPSASDVVTVTSFGSTLTIRRPGSTAEGDVLVASVAARLSGSASITPPSGWSLIRRDSNAPQYESLTQALYYKVAGAGEPSSYTWTLTSAVSATGAILDVKGVDASAPVDSHSGAFTPTQKSFVAPSVTTSAAGDLVVAFFAMTSSRTIRPASEMSGALRCALAESRLGPRQQGRIVRAIHPRPHGRCKSHDH